jgi:DNA-binding MarR family transcriptional regulator
MTSIWNSFGFADNPYNPRPIQPDQDGEKLLVGRSRELNQIKARLSSGGTHATLEGQNGVGKTSLVAIALYQLFKSFESGSSSQAIIPVMPPLQLTPSDTSAGFKKKVLFRVAKAMINHHVLLQKRGYNVPPISDLRQWIEEPIATGRSGGITTPLGGVSGGVSKTFNTGQGFADVGFETMIQDWLKELFPTHSAGSFVFVIDNLEILETSQAARQLLEALRDDLLGMAGLSWVVCGARGIMRSAASSGRLQGVLADPLELSPLPDTAIPDLVKARIEVFSVDQDPFIPVDQQGFDYLYTICNRNLRNAFKFAEDFAIHIGAEAGEYPEPDELRSQLEQWMKERAELYEGAASGITATGWRVFDKLCQSGGFTSPSQFADYGFESSQAMRPYLKNLEDANLIQTSVDEDDNRRRSIAVSSSGWVVAYKRSGYTITV